jgi:hypothetical protein
MPMQVPTSLPDIGYGTSGISSAFLDTLRNYQSPSIFNMPQWGQVQSLLQPDKSGLSPNLNSMLNIGQQVIQRQTQQDVASQMSTALGRGMEGSSIEAAGVAGAQAAGQNSLANLLSSIFGQQNQLSSQYVQNLMGGMQANQQLDFNQLQILLQYLQSQMESTANIGMYGEGMGSAMNMAGKKQSSDIISALIGAGGMLGAGALKYGAGTGAGALKLVSP